MGNLQKIKDTLIGAPIGATIGGIIGWAVAKRIGYDKTLMVISFITVGTIIGGTIGASLIKK